MRVTVSASPASAVLFEKMTSLNLYPVHAYGLTETYGPVSMVYYLPEWDRLPKPDWYAKMARQGHGVITGLPVRVVKADQGSALINVARNGSEVGEVIIQGNLCAKGYYRDPAATAKLFSGGWMHTGDLAVQHDDGAIQILDRAKDIIISGKHSCNPTIEVLYKVLTHVGGENISSVVVEVVNELPKTSTGKMQKKVLRELEVKCCRRVANL